MGKEWRMEDMGGLKRGTLEADGGLSRAAVQRLKGIFGLSRAICRGWEKLHAVNQGGVFKNLHEVEVVPVSPGPRVNKVGLYQIHFGHRASSVPTSTLNEGCLRWLPRQLPERQHPQTCSIGQLRGPQRIAAPEQDKIRHKYRNRQKLTAFEFLYGMLNTGRSTLQYNTI